MGCCNQFFEVKELLYLREKLIEEYYQKAIDSGLPLTDFPTMKKGSSSKDEQLSIVFQRFIEFLRDKDLLWEHGILVLANPEGKVVELAYHDKLPEFFKKKIRCVLIGVLIRLARMRLA
ncbi:hypothetical protein [Tepidibacillus marianensis]|uniref:hypothetical protein n=1 Tax=Tepidibacillus marianensis TaxID=3131995 RepID=UPI0030D60C64